MMKGTSVDARYPDYLTTLPWEKTLMKEGLIQALGSEPQSPITALIGFRRETVNLAGLPPVADAGRAIPLAIEEEF